MLFIKYLILGFLTEQHSNALDQDECWEADFFFFNEQNVI